MHEHQKSEHFQIYMETQFQQLLSSPAQNPKEMAHPTSPTAKGARLSLLQSTSSTGWGRPELILEVGSRIRSRGWLGFCTLRSLLVCFNSMALGTSYEPTDAAHLSVKGQEPSRHSDSSAQFVQFSERPRMEVCLVARNLSSYYVMHKICWLPGCLVTPLKI